MKYLMIAILLSSFQFSFAGPRVVKNGGDLEAIEFVGIGQQLVKSMAEKKTAYSFDYSKFAKAVDESTVESTSKSLSLNGVDKDAINTPSTKSILFNRIAWAGKGDLIKKAILVLHEYLGIAGIEDQKYDISTKVIEAIGFGKVNYRGEIYDRKLKKDEVAKLLPMYLKMIVDQAPRLPSPVDNEILQQMQPTAMGFTYPVNGGRGGGLVIEDIQLTIQRLQILFNDLRAITNDERVQSTTEVVEAFKNAASPVKCELGYKSVTLDDRIVKCVISSEGEKTIILSVDGKSFEPLGVLYVDFFFAG